MSRAESGKYFDQVAGHALRDTLEARQAAEEAQALAEMAEQGVEQRIKGRRS